jgi:uncharacterized phage protein (TIGR02218 family)
MKSISAALQNHLTGELTTLAYLFKITRTDGVIKGFTTFDRNLTLSGVTYVADGAVTPSALESTSGMATDNLEIAGLLNSTELAESEIEAGLYDYARIDVYVCNWADLTQGVVQLRRGWLGQVTIANGIYAAELRGMHDLLQRPFGVTYSAECRHDLGDSNCTINLGMVTITGSVTTVMDAAHFSDTSRTEASGQFNYGKLTWTSGANQGRSMEVKNWDLPSQTFSLWLPMANPIAVGDHYTVYAGCDKRFTTCQSKFSNGINFGGFPYVPGVGNILKYPQSN